MATTIGANLHVDDGAYVRCTLEPGSGHVVAIGEGPLLVSFTAETSEVAETIGRAFLDQASRMRRGERQERRGPPRDHYLVDRDGNRVDLYGEGDRG